MKAEAPWQVYSDRFLSKAGTIVVKIGSALLIDESTGDINRHWLKCLAEDITNLRRSKKRVVIVSSGAIALGKNFKPE